MSCSCSRRTKICGHGHHAGIAYDGDWTVEIAPECCSLCPQGAVISRYKEHDMEGNMVRAVVSSTTEIPSFGGTKKRKKK